MCTTYLLYTVDCKKIFDKLFRQKLNTQNTLCNVRRPIQILVAKVWQQNLDYVKNLQAKYFTSENILIYGIILLLLVNTFHKKTLHKTKYFNNEIFANNGSLI